MLNVVLVEPEIPPNTGTIGRLCLATNSRLHLVEPLGFDLDDRAVRRAGLDYWKDVQVSRWPSFEALQLACEEGSKFHFFTTKTGNDLWSANYSETDYLVFGCETRGLPESLLEQHSGDCRTIATDNVRSLNLATSVAIALFEAVRQVKKANLAG